MNLATIAFALATSVLAACSPQSNGISSNADSGRIVNGSLVTDDDFVVGGIASSTVVIVTTVDNKESRCTGSLIRPNIVLTAGHCAPRGTDPKNMIVAAHVLNLDLNQTAKAYPASVTSIIVNPGFQPSDDPNKTVAKDDLALLVLDRSLPSQLARLPEVTENPLSPKSFLAVGYGQSDDRHSLPAEIKGSGVLRQMVYSSHFEIKTDGDYEGMLTTIAGDSSVCHGDSGGPLFAIENGTPTDTIVGITEAGDPQYVGPQGDAFKVAQASESSTAISTFYQMYPMAHDCIGSMNAFVDVRAHLPWINSNIEFIEGIMQEPSFSSFTLSN